MRFNLTKDDVDNVLTALEVQHQKLMKEGEAWGYDLEGDFKRYTDIRQKELNLAYTINRFKRQRTSQSNPNPEKAAVPLAYWEVELLTGKLPEDMVRIEVDPSERIYNCVVGDKIVRDAQEYDVIGVSTEDSKRIFVLQKKQE